MLLLAEIAGRTKGREDSGTTVVVATMANTVFLCHPKVIKNALHLLQGLNLITLAKVRKAETALEKPARGSWHVSLTHEGFDLLNRPERKDCWPVYVIPAYAIGAACFPRSFLGMVALFLLAELDGRKTTAQVTKAQEQWVSLPHYASVFGCSKKTIQRAMALLHDAGLATASTGRCDLNDKPATFLKLGHAGCLLMTGDDWQAVSGASELESSVLHPPVEVERLVQRSGMVSPAQVEPPVPRSGMVGLCKITQKITQATAACSLPVAGQKTRGGRSPRERGFIA